MKLSDVNLIAKNYPVLPDPQKDSDEDGDILCWLDTTHKVGLYFFEEEDNSISCMLNNRGDVNTKEDAKVNDARLNIEAFLRLTGRN